MVALPTGAGGQLKGLNSTPKPPLLSPVRCRPEPISLFIHTYKRLAPCINSHWSFWTWAPRTLQNTERVRKASRRREEEAGLTANEKSPIPLQEGHPASVPRQVGPKLLIPQYTWREACELKHAKWPIMRCLPQYSNCRV